MLPEFDPKELRKLAAQYRARSLAEPEVADMFLEIAKDIESEAEWLEGSPLTD